MVGIIFTVPNSWVDGRRHFPIPVADLLSLSVSAGRDIRLVVPSGTSIHMSTLGTIHIKGMEERKRTYVT